MNALAFCLGVAGFTSPPIGQALADNAFDRLFHAFSIADAKSLAFVVTEIVFGQIALQMLLAYMVVHACNAALHDREVAVDGASVPEPAAHVFLNGMINGAVAGKFVADLGVNG